MRRTIFSNPNFFRFACPISLATLLAAAAFLASSATGSAAEPASKTATKAELEKRFAENMSGSTLIGHYVTGEIEKGKDLPEDRYHLEKVTKAKDDTWLFSARIEVEGQDVTLPVPLKVLWAGDTPVITLEEVSLPGLGTFSAHVVIDGDKYAGTWSHGDEGGEMFGRIEKTDAKETKPEK